MRKQLLYESEKRQRANTHTQNETDVCILGNRRDNGPFHLAHNRIELTSRVSS